MSKNQKSRVESCPYCDSLTEIKRYKGKVIRANYHSNKPHWLSCPSPDNPHRKPA